MPTAGTSQHVLWGAAVAVWDWMQANDSGISILLSLAGFVGLWWQIRRTRDAATAAEAATKEAVSAIAKVDTVSDLASVKAGLHNVQVALEGNRLETASVHAQMLKESLFQLRGRQGFADKDKLVQLQSIVTLLAKVQERISRRQEDEVFKKRVPALSAGLSESATQIAAWMEELRYRQGGN